MPHVIARVPPGFSHLQTVDIAIDGPNTVVVAWRNNMRSDRTDMGSIACVRSADGGATWSEPMSLKEHDADTAYGNVILYGENGAFVAYIGRNPASDPNSEDQTLLALRSTDGGATWADFPLDLRYPHPTIGGGHLYKHGDTYLMPFHRNDNRDHFRTHGVLASRDLRTWELRGEVPNPDGVFLQEGFIAPHQDDPTTLLIAMRTDAGYLFTAESADGGATWTDAAREIAIPNHNVKGCFATDAHGQYVTIFNTARDRGILNYKTRPHGAKRWAMSRPFPADATDATDAAGATDGPGWNCYTMMIEHAPSRFYVVWERNCAEICFAPLDVPPEGAVIGPR